MYILEIEMGWPLVLKDVRHVPDFHLILVLTLKLDDGGYNVNLVGEKLKLSRDSILWLEGVYVVNFTSCRQR